MSKQELTNRSKIFNPFPSTPVNINNNNNNNSPFIDNYFSPTSFCDASSPTFPSPMHTRRRFKSDATLAILSQLFQNSEHCPDYMNAVATIKNKQGEEEQNVFTLIQELAQQISFLDQQNNSLETHNRTLKAQVCEIAVRKQQQERDIEEPKPKVPPIGTELPSPRLQKILSFSAKNSPPSSSRTSSSCNSISTTPLWFPMENNELDMESIVSKSPTLNPIAKRNSSSLHKNVLINQSAANTPRLQKQNSSDFPFTPVEEDIDSDSSGDDELAPSANGRYWFP